MIDLENNSNEKPRFMQGGGFVIVIILVTITLLLALKFLIY